VERLPSGRPVSMALEQKTEEGGSKCTTHPTQPRRGPFDLTDRAGPSYNVADRPGNERTRCRHRQFPAPSGGSEPLAQDRPDVHRRRASVRGVPRSPGSARRALSHSPRARRGLHRRPASALQAHDRAQPLPQPPGVLQMGGRGGDDRDLADGADEATDRRRAAAADAE
jgi:hypothetical protein